MDKIIITQYHQLPLSNPYGGVYIARSNKNTCYLILGDETDLEPPVFEGLPYHLDGCAYMEITHLIYESLSALVL